MSCIVIHLSSEMEGAKFYFRMKRAVLVKSTRAG